MNIIHTSIIFFCCFLVSTVFANDRQALPLFSTSSIEKKILFEDSTVEKTEPSPYSGNINKVKFGVYIVNISDIDFPKNEYHVKLWGWAVHNMKKLETETGFEVSNAKSTPNFTNFFRTEYDDVIWDQFFVSTVIFQRWETQYYPFDSQKLNITIEPIEYETDELILVPDTEESRLAPNLELNGWAITNFEIKNELAVYHTTSGDPKAKKGSSSTYSKINIIVTIKRYGGTTFSFLFIGMFMGSFLIVLTLLSNIYNTGKEFIGGALVVAIGSQYIINSNLPTGAAFGFSHTVGIITFSGLALVAILTTFHNKIMLILDQNTNSTNVSVSTGVYDSDDKNLMINAASKKAQAKKWLKISITLNWILLILFIFAHVYINGYLMLYTS
ncbi:MAG: hypothetical protein HQK75_17905 [Candidatus Magnetomorum sp.]|nr:hypothetical protein [Candidatus Magnetomorum sp.]